MKKLMMAILATAAVASVAEAQRRPGPGRPPFPPPGQGQQQQLQVTINMNDQEYRGAQGETIPLRQLIQRQRPQIQLNQFEIQSARVLAKSRAGRAQMSLIIGNRQADRVIVPGRPVDFDRPAGNTFTNLFLENTTGNSTGVWQLEVRGNVKVRQIVVSLREIRRGGGPGGPIGPRPPVPGPIVSVQKVGEGRFDKVIPDVNTYNVRLDRVQELRVVALDKPIRIHELTVVFANGAVQRFPINGDIVIGRDLRLQTGGRDIRQVQVVGTSLDLFGSRATYKIDAYVLNR